MTINQIKNLELRGYNTKSVSELKQIVRQVAKVVNPKINRLFSNQSRIAKDALDYIEKTGDLIHTTGDTAEELIHELTRARYFLNLKTSSVKGAKQEQRRREEIIRERFKKDFDFDKMTQDDINKMVSDEWEKFHRFKENNPSYDSKRLLEIYKESNYSILQAQTDLDQYKQEEWEKLQDAYKQAEEITGYKPKWEF